MSWTARQKAIVAALNDLMKTCGHSGESGTEAMFQVLADAIDAVAEDWGMVEQSHAEGLSYDVNAMLARAIDDRLEIVAQ
jgi:hypothetical protein